MLRVWLFLAAATLAIAAPAFESATIRRTGHFPEGCNLPDTIGGPGTNSPTAFAIPAMRPIDLLSTAFRINSTWVLGLDRYGFAWNGTILYTIKATVPRGATKDQIAPMLQDLLARRFHLKAQRETRQLDAYELTVAGSGSKLTKSADTRLIPIHHSCQGKLDNKGFPAPCPGCAGMAFTGQNGINRIGAKYLDFADLPGELSDLLGRPVLDKTGLRGRFDFALEYPSQGLAGPGGLGGLAIATGDGAANLIAAVETHLGLILKPVRAPVEVLVVEHLDRSPTPNSAK